MRKQALLHQSYFTVPTVSMPPLHTHTFSPQWSVSSSQLLIFQLLLSAVKTRNAHASAKNLAMRNLWNWVTWHQTPAHWCVTTVFKPHWALVLHQKTTSPSPTSSPTTFFFYTKIHESLATGVTVRWIKIFIAPFALPEIPSVQLNISERRARSPKVTDNRANAKWNWWAKFSTLCLRNVPCNPLHCVLFFYSVPNPPPLTPKPHMSLSREEANSWKRLLRLFPGFMCSSGIYWHNLIMGPSQNGINGR